MTPGEYQQACLRTWQKDRPDRLEHAELGALEEAAEIAGVVKKHVYLGHELDVSQLKKEVGDFLYYSTMEKMELGFGVAESWDYDPLWPRPTVSLRNMAAAFVRIHAGNFQHEAMRALVSLIDGHFTLEEAAIANIEKLRKRYPDGFSTERSVNREG